MANTNEQYAEISDTRNLVSRKIVRVVSVGERRMYDLEVACSTHNFLLANNIVTSNSHSCCYAYNSYITAYLKANFPEEFMIAYLNVESQRKKWERVMDLERECVRMGINVLPRDINKSEGKWKLARRQDEKNGIPKSEIRPSIYCKGLPSAAGEEILIKRPYASIRELAEKTDSRAVDAESIAALCDAKFFKTKRDKLVEEFKAIREDTKMLRAKGRVSVNLFAD
jgi:DNA polymerase III alpha subunit